MCSVGIAAVYRETLGDQLQLASDPYFFFEASAHAFEQYRFLETEVLLPLTVWKYAYAMANYFALPINQCVGIAVNVLLVGLSGLLAIRTTASVYGTNSRRLQTLLILLVTSGNIWLFQSIHIRDAYPLLILSLGAYIWTHVMRQDSVLAIASAVVFSIMAYIAFVYIRPEFRFLPALLVFAAAASKLLAINNVQAQRSRVAVNMFICVMLVASGLVIFNESAAQIASKESENYIRADSGSSISLAEKMILNQNPAIRIPLATVFVLYFPLPVVSDVIFRSAYHLFKTFNAIQHYIILPMLMVSAYTLVRVRAARKPEIIFPLVVSLSALILVGSTSMETRHFGAFSTLTFMAAVIPDYSVSSTRAHVWRLVAINIVIVAIGHVMWWILKR